MLDSVIYCSSQCLQPEANMRAEPGTPFFHYHEFTVVIREADRVRIPTREVQIGDIVVYDGVLYKVVLSDEMPGTELRHGDHFVWCGNWRFYAGNQSVYTLRGNQPFEVIEGTAEFPFYRGCTVRVVEARRLAN